MVSDTFGSAPAPVCRGSMFAEHDGGSRLELQRTRVKICGITRVSDAIAAAKLGADAIGLNFYPATARYVDGVQAHAIVNVLPPFVTVVGLFVDADDEQVRALTEMVRLDLLQFHGDEAPEFCQQFEVPYVKAIRVRAGLDLHREARRYGSATALLLDTYQPDTPGGSGKTFDWSLIPGNLPKAVILAGGLTSRNVAQAIRRVRPYAVDVSGGVEESKGIKDADKMAAFMQEVTRAGTIAVDT